MTSFPFGVLPRALHVRTANWEVEPLPTCTKTIEAWQARGPDRLWTNPPLLRQVETFVDKRGRARRRLVKNSEHEAIVWYVPATHRLRYIGTASLHRRTTQRGLASLLIYLLGTLFNVELQHRSWSLSGKQHKRTGGLFLCQPVDVGRALEAATVWYRSSSRNAQVAMISALFLHNHVPAFTWDWEEFAWQYSAFDAAWHVGGATGVLPSRPTPHRLRFQVAARAFGLRSDRRMFARWVRCRNSLIHQLTWGRYLPGHGPPMAVRRLQLPLRGFTTVALLAAMDMKGKYRRAWWNGRSQSLLDVT